MDRWSGKVALVTGASAGIGAAIAVELVKKGLKVVGLARRVDRIEALQKEVEGAPGKLYPLKGDVSKDEDVKATFKWIKENLGSIHVLVNNAGIGRLSRVVDGDPSHVRTILDVNVVGLCLCTREAYLLMKETGVDDGHIILINSIAGHYVPGLGEPLFNVYAGSKHAVTGLTETIRQELRHLKTKIRVTSISPGVVKTEIMAATLEGSNIQSSPDHLEGMKQLPGLESKDIADAVLYVLSTPPHVQVHELTIRPVGEPL